MKSLTKNIYFIILLLTFISCATNKKKKLAKEKEKEKVKSEIVQELTHQNSAVKKNIKPDRPIDPQDFNTYTNKHVQKWINYFTKKDKARFQVFLQRGQKYKELIQTVLADNQLPSILFYLPLIESGFNTRAYSKAHAVGPWQFIKGTGKRYGLERSHYIDERRDPIMSTEAGTKYLLDLYNVFNSWELAISAYNCGEIRVLRAIMIGNTRDFWTLVRKKLLPPETRNYVPKFLAAAIIGENPKKYGINVLSNSSYPDVEATMVPGGVSLKNIAKAYGISLNSLKELNPSIRRGLTPPYKSRYEIWMPPKFSKLEKEKFVVLQKLRTYQKRSFPGVYRVKRGDTLISISRKNRISLTRLKRLNKITSSRIFVGQKLILKTRSYHRVQGNKFYFVRRGDFLGKIARKFGLRLGYLKKLNGIINNRVYVGQKLNVTKGKRNFSYRVRSGDSLLNISRFYKTSIQRIKKLNRLRSSVIRPGQILKI
jgi:membrane-bound lytic murein transglycosylase D